MDMQQILCQKLLTWHDNLLWAIKKWMLILCNNTKVASFYIPFKSTPINGNATSNSILHK